MLPNAKALTKFSHHLATSRPTSSSIPFPGCPHKSDLEILDERPPALEQSSAPVRRCTDKGKAAEIASLSAQDVEELRQLKEDLVRVCLHAKERGVRVIVDAEYRFACSLHSPTMAHPTLLPPPYVRLSFRCGTVGTR